MGVSAGCYKEAPQTQAFLLILEAGESHRVVPARSLPVPPSRCGVLAWPENEGCSLLLLQTNPIVGAPPSWPHLTLITFQRPYLHVLSQWGFRPSTQEFWGTNYGHSVHSREDSHTETWEMYEWGNSVWTWVRPLTRWPNQVLDDG